MLLSGLEAALDALRLAGCRRVYLDGSFVSNKPDPNDYDACWEQAGVDWSKLDPVLLTFDRGRATQKAKYRGELFIAEAAAEPFGTEFIDFFQIDKVTFAPKGIIALNLGNLPC